MGCKIWCEILFEFEIYNRTISKKDGGFLYVDSVVSVFPLIWNATGLLSEKTNPFDLLTHPIGQGCKSKIFACMLSYISFPLIWFATVLTFWSHPKGQVSVCKSKFFAHMLLYTSFPLIWYATWPLLEKKIDLLSPPKVKGTCKGKI